MCKTQNLYVLHLAMVEDGSITWDTSILSPQLINKPCKIKVKQVVTEMRDGSANLLTAINLRVIHNIKTNAMTNFFSGSSNILGFIDSYSVRNTATNHYVGFTSSDLELYAPNGLPNELILNRVGTVPPATDLNTIIDDATLLWAVTLEVTINPDEN